MKNRSLVSRSITAFAAVALLVILLGVVGVLATDQIATKVERIGAAQAPSTPTGTARAANTEIQNARAEIILGAVLGVVVVGLIGAFFVVRFTGQEGYYRTLVENVSEVVAVISSDRKIQYVNPSIKTVLGYTEAEVMAAGTLASIHPDDVGAAQIELQRLDGSATAQGRPQMVRHRHKDGHWLMMEGIVHKIQPRLARPAFVLTLRDITERQRMELALRQSEEHMRYLANGAFEGLNIIDNGLILTSNDALARMFGYQVEELIRREVMELVAPESRHLVPLHAGEDPVDYELVALRKDGSTFPAQILRRKMLYFGREVSVVAVRDITERKQTEQAIREKERRYQNLVETMRDVLMTISADGRITSLNSAFEKMLGWTPSEWIGKTYADLVHPEEVRKAHEALASAVAGRENRVEEYRMKRRDGTYSIGEVLFTREQEESRAPEIIGIARDITERKTLELQMLRSQRLDGLGSIASGIAHDLNNVLAPILLAANILKAKVTDMSQRLMIESVERCARRGSEVVKQVLTFARGTSGELKPQQLRYVVKEVQSMMRESFPTSIDVSVDVESELRLVKGDATQLVQVLMNLCVNARDAMTAGGRLKIAARNLTVSGAQKGLPDEVIPGDWVALSVEDSGMGIPQAIRDKVFEPFFTTKEAGKGTGLGLFTVSRIVRDHRGSLALRSEEGKGTTITVYLPAVVSGKIENPVTAEKTLPRGNGELVLVVEDELSLLQIARETLEAFGYRTLGASNGAEALAQFVSDPGNPVDIALLDMHIPVMDGVQTIKLLRRMDPGLKVLVMSGTGGESDSELASLGVLGFLAKPFAGERLLETIEGALKTT